MSAWSIQALGVLVAPGGFFVRTEGLQAGRSSWPSGSRPRPLRGRPRDDRLQAGNDPLAVRGGEGEGLDPVHVVEPALAGPFLLVEANPRPDTLIIRKCLLFVNL
jgi:hypothetical protein